MGYILEILKTVRQNGIADRSTDNNSYASTDGTSPLFPFKKRILLGNER